MQPDNQTPQVPDQTQPQVVATPPPPEQPAEQPAPMAVQEPSQETEQTPQLPDGPSQLPPVEPVQWQAPEYAQHDKSPIWYVGFAVVVIVLMAAAILLMRSPTFAVLIPVMAAALMVYTHRPPRELTYVLSEKGLYINDQLHPLGEFKSFGVVHDGVQNSLVLIPVKRFRPSLTVYFPAEVGERVVDLLGAYLPMRDIELDAFDKIVRKLHI